ncbi:MAG TPA: hypothetical protein VFY25_16960 [Anaerolineales bacterium]|nr:hypothetical protein [Anaerolineales bacterium]
MRWQKKGLIFKPDHHYDWMVSHAQVPIADPVSGNRLRLYFGTRDSRNRTVTTFIEVAAKNPNEILHLHDRPVLSLGRLGCFDDSGVMPSWIVNHEGKKYLYYIGWNIGVTVPYRNSIGLAVSEDGGQTFNRLYEGPILDRIHSEPHLCATPCVLIENSIWRMWYLSGTEWKIHSGHPEPYYHIKYAESTDGVHWKRDGKVCIDFRNSEEGGIARPSIIKDGDIYRMWYSYRGSSDYRMNKSHAYRVGYAESFNGTDWKRKDELAGIDLSDTDWDSEMIAYPFVIKTDDRLMMFYNGNGFGRSGVGYAIVMDSKETRS